MDYGKLRGPVRENENSEKRIHEKTSMSEQAKVGLADEVATINLAKRSSREQIKVL